MKKDIEALFEGVELSEEIKTKIVAIMEASVEEQVAEKVTQLEEKAKEYGEYVLEEMKELTQKYISEELIPTINTYSEVAVKEFVTENSAKIDGSVKVELAESFLKNLSTVAESFNVQIPEGAAQVDESIKTKLDNMTERFERQLEETKKLQEQVVSFKKEKVLESIASNLTESEKEKFSKRLEKVEFINEEQFTGAANELYESYFPSKADEKQEPIKLDESKDPAKAKSKQESWLDSLVSNI